MDTCRDHEISYWPDMGCPMCAAQSRIAELEAEVERLKSQKWFTLHTDTMNDLVQMGMARDTAWNDAIEAAALAANDYEHYELEEVIRSLRR